MVDVITLFSRITILSFVLVFTAIDLIQIFEYRLNETFSSIISIVQSVMLVLFLINSTIVLYMAKEDPLVIALAIGTLIFFIVYTIILKTLTGDSSLKLSTLTNNVLFFISLGMVTLIRLKISVAVKQFVAILIAALVSVLVITVLKRVHKIERFMYSFAAIGILLLLVVSFVGQTENGAKLSFVIGSLRIQPSEIVKLTFLFFISGCIVTFKDTRGFAIATLGAAAHVLILVFSKDLGVALIFLITYVFVIFIAFKNYIVLSIELIGATVGGILAYNLFPHIQTRFIAWTDPLSVVDDKGYQISQSLFAIGTGGWMGSGLNRGMPNKIPVVTMDFIFAAISEELGAIVGICVIICFACTSIYIFNTAFNCNNSFYMLVSSGIGVIFAVQTVLNIGGVIKFIPSTGVTLPFVSYGGNSMVSLMTSLLIVSCANSLYLNTSRGRGHYDR